MLLFALCFLVFPLKGMTMMGGGVILLCFSLFSFAIYFFTTNLSQLQQWYTTGKQHYELRVEFERFGGIDGAIFRINQKLMVHPNDQRGWLILGRLYSAKHDDEKAFIAFKKARELEP